MYADRYGPRPVNRGSLIASVAIVGGLLGVALMSSPYVQTVLTDPPLVTYRVGDPPPPPPPDPTPPPETHVQTRATPRIDQPKVLVPTDPPVAPYVAPPVPGPTVDPGLSTGDGGTAPYDPPKVAPPVLTTAGVDPRYAGDFQPTYPAAERRAGNEGVVTIKVLIGVDGRVKQTERVAAASDEFWRVTEQRALSKWRFRPATRDGVPIESWRTMTVRFRMEDE